MFIIIPTFVLLPFFSFLSLSSTILIIFYVFLIFYHYIIIITHCYSLLHHYCVIITSLLYPYFFHIFYYIILYSIISFITPSVNLLSFGRSYDCYTTRFELFKSHTIYSKIIITNSQTIIDRIRNS